MENKSKDNCAGRTTQCFNNTSTSGTVSMVRQPQKAPQFQDSADLATRLASITLTRNDLKQLDAPFVDSEQMEVFRRIVFGCLVRIDRQAVGQKKHVIAQISDLARPFQTRKIFLANRRIFVDNLGCFGFEQVARQMPSRTEYGAWIANMEMQSLPLPSDEFLRTKTVGLMIMRELLSRAAAANVVGRNLACGRTSKAEDEGLTEGREEEKSGRQDGEATADRRANRQGIMSSSASKMLATCSSAAMKKEGEVDSSDAESGELDDEDEDDEADDKETGADQNAGQKCSMVELASMAGGLVATWEHLRAVRIPLFMVRLLAEHNAGNCLQGCLVVCQVKADKKVIADEIDQVSSTGGIRFKHSRKTYQLKHLQNKPPNEKLFNHWIEKMAKWGEPLPSMAVYKKRCENVYKNCKRIIGEMNWSQDRLGINAQLRKEMESIRRMEEKIEAEQANGMANEQNLRQTYQQLLLRTNDMSSSSSSSSPSDEEQLVDESEMMCLNELVHSKELLDKVCLSYDFVQTMARYPALRHFLSECFVKCRTRDTNETIIDVIAGVNPIEIRFKHSDKPFLLKELCVSDGQISTEMFIKWIMDMARWEDYSLPSIIVCEQHKKRALRALEKAKRFDPEQQLQQRELNQKQAWTAIQKRTKKELFEKIFGEGTRQIMVNPQQLVQLHKLGEAEFTRVVTGLFVCVRYSIDNSKTLSLEQIRTVSFDHLPAYTMCGHRLIVQLHFERPEAAPVPILNVQFGNKNNFEQQLIKQHTKMVGSFVPPSLEFVLSKKEQLRCALSKTQKL